MIDKNLEEVGEFYKVNDNLLLSQADSNTRILQHKTQYTFGNVQNN